MTCRGTALEHSYAGSSTQLWKMLDGLQFLKITAVEFGTAKVPSQVDATLRRCRMSDEYAYRMPNPYEPLVHQGKGASTQDKHHIS